MSEILDHPHIVLQAQVIKEQQLVNHLHLHKKRALIAFLNDQEKYNILMGRLPMLGEDLAQIETKIEQYNLARVSRLPYTPTNPIVSENDPILENIRSRPDIMQVFTSGGFEFRPVMINLKQVLSLQSTIRTDNLDERIHASQKDSTSLLQLYFPSDPPMEATYKIDERSCTLTTSNPNLMYQPSILVGAQTLPNIALTPQIKPNFFNVAHYQGRYFVREGHHRTAGLLHHSTETSAIAPCILIEAQTIEQVGWQQGMFPISTLLSDYPPYLSDFWNESLSCDIIQKPVHRVIRMQIDTFEV